MKGYAVRGTVQAIQRRTNTASGNPRWRVTLRERSGHMPDLLTEPDTQVAHKISERLVGQYVEVSLNEDGRIVAIEANPEEGFGASMGHPGGHYG